MDFDELAFGQKFSDCVSVSAVGRDESGQCDDAGIGKQFGDLADAADVFRSVFG